MKNHVQKFRLNSVRRELLKNISVQQIAHALRSNIDRSHQVLIWDVNTVRFSGDCLVQDDRFFHTYGVLLANIAFAIKRTWSTC